MSLRHGAVYLQMTSAGTFSRFRPSPKESAVTPFIEKEIQEYANNHTRSEPDLLLQLITTTYELTHYPEMLTGRMLYSAQSVPELIAKVRRAEIIDPARLRAEIPGTFHAMPTRGFAMYAPELKANSDEIKLRVED